MRFQVNKEGKLFKVLGPDISFLLQCLRLISAAPAADHMESRVINRMLSTLTLLQSKYELILIEFLLFYNILERFFLYFFLSTAESLL